jgi:hypothetical protein
MPLQTHIAGGLKQVRANLALFEGGNKDAVRPASQQPHMS